MYILQRTAFLPRTQTYRVLGNIGHSRIASVMTKRNILSVTYILREA